MIVNRSQYAGCRVWRPRAEDNLHENTVVRTRSLAGAGPEQSLSRRPTNRVTASRTQPMRPWRSRRRSTLRRCVTSARALRSAPRRCVAAGGCARSARLRSVPKARPPKARPRRRSTGAHARTKRATTGGAVPAGAPHARAHYPPPPRASVGHSRCRRRSVWATEHALYHALYPCRRHSRHHRRRQR